jgi:inositol oxygenase
MCNCGGSKLLIFSPHLECQENWFKFDHAEMTIREALEMLNNLIDDSDPDLVALPNIIHAFQTAERARQEFPEHDWLHLTGLIHDVGKIMAFFGECKCRHEM